MGRERDNAYSAILTLGLDKGNLILNNVVNCEPVRCSSLCAPTVDCHELRSYQV